MKRDSSRKENCSRLPHTIRRSSCCQKHGRRRTPVGRLLAAGYSQADSTVNGGTRYWGLRRWRAREIGRSSPTPSVMVRVRSFSCGRLATTATVRVSATRLRECVRRYALLFHVKRCKEEQTANDLTGRLRRLENLPCGTRDASRSRLRVGSAIQELVRQWIVAAAECLVQGWRRRRSGRGCWCCGGQSSDE